MAALDQFAEAGVRWRFAQLVRLLLLTGRRVREIMCADWSWFDEQTAVLTIPADNHKTGSSGDDRKVHLPPAAVSILRELRRRSNSEWIIAGDDDGHLVGYWRMWDDLLAAISPSIKPRPAMSAVDVGDGRKADAEPLRNL